MIAAIAAVIQINFNAVSPRTLTLRIPRPRTSFEGQPMPHTHAVVWLDHHVAEIHQFDADAAQTRKFKAHHHSTRQHNSDVRAVHEFFGEVCDALSPEKEVLMTGSRTALADFKHYVVKHRPALEPRIAGWEIVDHPTSGQLVALARDFFAKYDNLKGTRPLK